MDNIAIVVVAFNRVNSLKRLLESLNNIKIPNEKKVTLYISIDKAKNESEKNRQVIEYAKEFEWKFGEKIVDVKKENMGLRKHIIQCGNLTEKYENIIVLEDDIVVSPLIYKYAEQVIEFYKNDSDIAGFGLYSFQRNPLNSLPFLPINNGTDIYFMQYACSWGQLWTKDRWKDFYKWYIENENRDFSEYMEIPNNLKQWGENSWLKYHIIYTILNNKYFVYPQFGLTTNFSEAGTHNDTSSIVYQCYTLSYDNNDNIKFRFTSVSEACNVYDAYFENVKLKSLLKSKNKIIADFYGEKKEEYIKKQTNLLLTTNKYNYKILKSYSLQMYPYEQNLLNNIEGTDIFLYDINIYEKNKYKNEKSNLYKYLYKLEPLAKKDIFYIMRLIIKKIKTKLKRV